MVRVDPEPFADPCMCHQNVETQVAVEGGRRLTGYYFLALPDRSVYQAIGHSVWETSNLQLRDITPFSDHRSHVCFGVTDAVIHRNAFMHLHLSVPSPTMSYYVYILVDPRNRRPFYVGKGTGKRAQQHLWEISREHNPYKTNVIRSIRAEGFEPEIVYAAEDISDEKTAYALEAKLIAFWGRKGYDKNGILTNVAIDLRSPNHKGRTYEDIYGVEGAAKQREKRRQLQLERGGYGPRQHTAATRALLRSTNGGERNGRYGKTASVETRAKIAAKKVGWQNPAAKTYLLIGPDGVKHQIRGWSRVIQFCKENNLSYGTFHNNLTNNWPPSKRGKNVGWTISVENTNG